MDAKVSVPIRSKWPHALVALVGLALVALLIASSAPTLAVATGIHPSGLVVSANGRPAGAAHAAPVVPDQNATVWRIKVIETGLAAGTKWTATVNGTSKHTTAVLNTFFVVNGTYGWTVANVTGYTVSPQSGSVTVNNANVTVTVTYTPGAGSGGGGGLISKYWWVAVVGLLILLLLIILVVRWRRRKAAPAEEWTPPAGAGTEPAPSDSGTGPAGPTS
jgi:hypothetical protein